MIPGFSLFTTSSQIYNSLSAYTSIELVNELKLGNQNWGLIDVEDRIEIVGYLDNQPFNWFPDLTSSQMIYRTKFGGGRKEPLAKAIGIKANEQCTVIDATAGMGRESFLLASLGCKVTAIERNPVIYLLLNNAVARLSNSDKCFTDKNQLAVEFSDSITFLKNLDEKLCPHVIYLDPMFPQREKSASVKKEMRIFKMLAGEDLDEAELLSVAREKALKRVVVKRPSSAPFVGDQKPSHQIKSKKHRFDVYLS